MKLALSLLILTLTATDAWSSSQPGNESQWPGFRGTTQSITKESNLPLAWSDQENIEWRASLRGYGQSSPVTWNGRVYVTTVEGAMKEILVATCIELATGKTLWEQTWPSAVPAQDSGYISKASPTPVVNEQAVVFLFESGDLIGASHDGSTLWHRRLQEDYGMFEGNHGMGSSPVLIDNKVVTVMDHGGQSYIAAFDMETGETLWKTDRRTGGAWSTPIIVERRSRKEIITSASGELTAYLPEDGRELWTYTGVTKNNVPSPSMSGEYIAIGSSRRKGCRLLKIADDDTVSLAWTAMEVSSGFGSPLIHQDRVYFVNDAGIAFCYDLDSGDLLWDQRLGESNWASPLGAGDRVYFFCRNGETSVIETSDEFKVLAENKMSVGPEDRIYGYAVAPGRFILRTTSELICIGGGVQ